MARTALKRLDQETVPGSDPRLLGPAVRRGFGAWLSPGSFDADGRQKRSLAELRRETGRAV